MAGKRPIAELMFADFVGVSLDQLWNQMAKFRYMFGGKTKCPAVIRLIYGAGMNAAAQHSQSVYAMMTSMPGPQDRSARNAGGRQGPADRGHPRRRSGAVLRT